LTALLAYPLLARPHHAEHPINIRSDHRESIFANDLDDRPADNLMQRKAGCLGVSPVRLKVTQIA